MLQQIGGLLGHFEQSGTLIEYDECVPPIGRPLHDPIVAQRLHDHLIRMGLGSVAHIQIVQQIHHVARYRTLLLRDLLLQVHGARVLAIGLVEEQIFGGVSVFVVVALLGRCIGGHLLVDVGGDVRQIGTDEIVQAIAVFLGYFGGVWKYRTEIF